MTKVALLLDQLHDSETALADEYRKVGERHAVEHDLWHNCHTFALRAQGRAAQVRQASERYGKTIGESHEVESLRHLAAQARRAVAELAGRRPGAGMLMLRDLQHLYLSAEEANLHWIMLGQVAQAARDAHLLGEVEVLQRQLLGEVKWIKTQIKETVPQALLT